MPVRASGFCILQFYIYVTKFLLVGMFGKGKNQALSLWEMTIPT